jgi:hypothetical protein
MGIVLVILIAGWLGMAGQYYGMKRRMVNLWKIVLPYIPVSMNQTNTWHWAKKAKYKKEIEEEIYWLVKKELSGIKLKYAKVRITYFFPDLRHRDIIDNYNPKFIMDGLVKSGLLEDDRHQYLGVPELVPAYDKGNAHTIIEIWRDENAETHKVEGERTKIKKLQERTKAKRKETDKGTTAQTKASTKKSNKKSGGHKP